MLIAKTGNLTYCIVCGQIRLSAGWLAMKWRERAAETDCRFEDEKLLYDATDSRNRIRSDRVGAALLSHA